LTTSVETTRSLSRLLLGLALIGGEDLFTRLREWEDSHPVEPAEPPAEPQMAPSSGGEALRTLVGLAFEAVDMTARAVSATALMAGSVAGATRSAVRPVTESALLRPLRAPVEYLSARGEARFQQILEASRAERRRSRRLAEDVTGLLLEDIVSYAGDNPGVKALVDEQVERLLPTLVNDPTIQQLLVEQLGEWISGLSTRAETLDPLVREVGDRYVAYLNEHPDDVQNLVQGQAVGMASEVRDQVRKMTVTGDTVLETLARNLLRRTPRSDLPPPKTQLPSRNGSGPGAPAGSEDGGL
jgi:hypothetical protein